MSDKERLELRNRTKFMFKQAFGFYMQHAFPSDELNPISCSPRNRDTDENNCIFIHEIILGNLNDVLGNFSLTLVDSLDTFAIMNDFSGFENAVHLVIDNVRFDKNVRVQVFETTIRVLGALLSAHLLATSPEFGFKLNWYKDELLFMAEDLGDRLMPAFATKTGIPYPRVNLKFGVLAWETTDTCTAGAGTLLIEFGILSRLTENPKYENAAKKALLKLWSLRSEIDLVGNSLDVSSGEWTTTHSGIGAGIDSFYEYLLKAYILFGDEEYLNIFEKAYNGVLKHIMHETGLIYKTVDMKTGNLAAYWIDSLSAFFPGLQVLYGDLENSIKLHALYFEVWTRFGALPERYNWNIHSAEIPNYPLRPELIESTYLLYQATKDPYYLQVGKKLLNDIESISKTRCGYASVQNVEKRTLDDRMESFFLSETLKYLYLLFDQDNFVSKLDSNYVFTTEGHFMPLPNIYQTKNQNGFSKKTCPKFNFNPLKSNFEPQLKMEQMDTIRFIVQELPEKLKSETGKETPTMHKIANYELKYVIEKFDSLIEGNPGNPAHVKIRKTKLGYTLNTLSGAHFILQKIHENYIITHVNKIVIEAGKKVSFMDFKNDQKLEKVLISNDLFQIESVLATFGPKFPANINVAAKLRIMGSDIKTLSTGCSVWNSKDKEIISNRIIVIMRGECMFSEKVFWAQNAGASGVIIISTDNQIFGMRNSIEKWDHGVEDGVDMIRIPSFFITKQNGIQLIKHALENTGTTWKLILSNVFSEYFMIEGGGLILNLRKESSSFDVMQRHGQLENGQSLKCLNECPIKMKKCCV